MSIQVKVYIDDHIFNASFFQHGILQNSDYGGQPTSIPHQAGIELTVPMIKDNLFEEWGYANRMMKYMEVHIIPIIPGSARTRVLRCYDSILVNFYADYQSDKGRPANMHLRINCGGIEPSWSRGVFSTYWRRTFPDDPSVTVLRDGKEPKIFNIEWVRPGSDLEIDGIGYGEKVGLRAILERPEGSTVTVTVERADGSAFADGQKTLEFTETLEDGATLNLAPFEVKGD